MIMILGTVPGERLMLPEFGSNLPLLVFEPNDELLVREVQEETAAALQRWDPNIVVVGVAPETQDDSLKIFIDYFDKRDLSQANRRLVLNVKRT
jgi:phage baseplate assembly protein W